MSYRLASLLFVSWALHAEAQFLNPVVYYPFDGHSVGTGIGVVSPKLNGELTYQPGPVQQTAVFDGTSSIEIPDNPTLRPAQWTIAAWVYPLQERSGGRVLEKGWSNSYWLTLAWGRAKFGFFSDKRAYEEVESKTVFKANEWQFVAGTYDGTTLRLYVNGKLEATKVPTGKPVFSDQPLVIGAKWRGIAGDSLLGALDEVHLYNQALSEPQIATLYQKRG